MPLPLADSGLPLDPMTLQALQAQQMQQNVDSQGGTPATRMNSQSVQQGMANLFPSPQMQQARQVQDALKGAQLTQDPGESPLDFGIRQLAAKRDAVAPFSPESAAQLTTQMIKLGNMRQEQQHLLAEDQRAKEREGDEHADEQRKQQFQSAVGIPIHLIDSKGGSLGSFDLATDAGKQSYQQVKAKNPDATSLSDADYAKHVDRMQELSTQADMKARAGLGAMGGFGDPKVEELLGSMARKGYSLPTGFRSKEQMLATLHGLLTKYDGLQADDIADLVGKGIIDFGATKRATQAGATILGRVTAASGELDAMLPIARDASAAVDRGDFVPFNELQQAVKHGTSSPEQKRLYVATQSVLNSYDLLAARGGTDAVKRAAQHKMIETADGPQAYNAALDMLETESRVARAGALSSIKAGTYGIGERDALAAQAAPPPTSTSQPSNSAAPQQVRTYDPSTGKFK